MSEWGTDAWRAKNRAWLASKFAPINQGFDDYVAEPLNKAMPGQWGNNLRGLLNFSKEFSPGADIRDLRDGINQAGRGLLDLNANETLGGIGLLGIGALGMVPGGDAVRVANDAIKKKASKFETPEFKNWFGDSKVVDEAGQPITVYHGTDKDFDVFDNDKSIGGQHWFTNKKSEIEAGNVGAAGKGRIVEANLSLQNPAGWKEYDQMSLDELISRGYDGLMLPDADGQITYVAFNPTQIKSINNSGKYNPKDPNILKSLAPIGIGAGVGAGLLSQQQTPEEGLIY